MGTDIKRYNKTLVKKIIIATWLCLAVISGCTKTEAPDPKENKDQEGKSILLGIIPERNIFEQMVRYEPIARYLSIKTGMNVELKALTRYGNIVDNFVSMGLDGAFLGSFTYALVHEKLGIEPLVRPVSMDGTSTYHGLIFARKDSGIKTAKQMRGKTFAFVDKATTAGYLLPLVFFREHGIEDYRTYFRETYFTGTHEDAIYDVLNKKADIGAAKNTIFYKIAKSDKRIIEELIILEKSPDVPENGLAVRKELDSSIARELKDTLMHMHHDEEGRQVLRNFGAERFIETFHSDYAAVYKYAHKIGLDLTTYNYLNN